MDRTGRCAERHNATTTGPARVERERVRSGCERKSKVIPVVLFGKWSDVDDILLVGIKNHIFYQLITSIFIDLSGKDQHSTNSFYFVEMNTFLKATFVSMRIS
jgi:hypothetical protein